MRMVNSMHSTLKIYTVIFVLFIWRQISLLVIEHLFKETGAAFNEIMFSYALFYFSTIIFSLFISFFSEKLGRKRIMYLWTIIALVTSIIPMAFTNKINGMFYSFFSGLSFGLGLPICLSLFANYTDVENRGRNGAFIFFSISLFFIFLALLNNLFNRVTLSFLSIVLLLLNFLALKSWKLDEFSKKEIYFTSITINKAFMLYFVSWSIFCLIDALEAPLLQYFLDTTFEVNFRNLILSLATLFTSFSILLGGFLADFYGRRNLLISGFVTLGIAYAIVGVASISPISWYVYSVVDGISTGFFVVIFVFVVWGDMAPRNLREKYYAIGTAPFFFINFIKELFIPYLEMIPVSTSFSLASFFLFLAVIPLLYAPETLPEKLIRRRELRKYVEKAKKIREKYEKEKD